LRGNNRADYFRASVPNNAPNVSPLLSLPLGDSRFQDSNSNVICSSAAEVAIFLRSTGTFTDDVDFATSSPQALFTLYFRQRLIVPDNDLITNITGNPVPYNMSPNFTNNWRNYLEVSTTQDPTNAANLYFNNLQDVTMPGRRWGQFRIDPSTGLINAGNLPDTSNLPSPANVISGDGNLFVSNGGRPAVRNNVYPCLGDDDSSQAGNDVLLTDVLSCNMSVLLSNSAYSLFTASNAPPATVPGTTPLPPQFVNLDNDVLTPYMTAPSSAFPRLFDTWSNRKDAFYDYSNWTAGIPMCTYHHPMVANHPLNGTRIQIRAIKIELRIWDSRTKQTRQSSIVVDM
jgi:hypothetical protein